MPWSVAPLRLGRGWVMAPDQGSLKRRWERLVRAEGTDQERLFRSTRMRTPNSSLSALPGQRTGTGRLARESGPCPPPVRITHGPFDEQWLIPDHRLLDAARSELWRVADDRQLFATEQGRVPAADGPALLVSALLPDGCSAAGRPGRIRPLYRRPGGVEPNLAPGLSARLTAQYGAEVTAEQFLAWALTAATTSPRGCAVPLTADPGLWRAGVELGQRALRIQLRGSRGTERPRLPGGRRPYVRAAVPARPEDIRYEPDEEVLRLGSGRIAPVPAGAWNVRVGGVRMLKLWFERRSAPAEPGTLESIRPSAWPQEWTSELLELITVLALLSELDPVQQELRRQLAAGHGIDRVELREAGVIPAPPAARRPASVLDHQEEGPEGQFALL
ncbi:type ISP restriction/modification enzyme [Streptomyces sp. NPDC051322]|uniref:type ISP restriction/modification enzyme n=1 Tax=Streptomyces sp. NPDC051322 TaxID=3154645 RepID=UPI003450EC06